MISLNREQAYNAQAAVEVESRLIVGQRVTDAPNDKEQWVPTVEWTLESTAYNLKRLHRMVGTS